MSTIKVSKETYEKLNERAGKLRARLRRPVSLDEVLNSAMKSRSPRPSDFAGTLVLSDREADEIGNDLSEFWSRWQSPSESP
jgi:hypothetical protein